MCEYAQTKLVNIIAQKYFFYSQLNFDLIQITLHIFNSGKYKSSFIP